MMRCQQVLGFGTALVFRDWPSGEFCGSLRRVAWPALAADGPLEGWGAEGATLDGPAQRA